MSVSLQSEGIPVNPDASNPHDTNQTLVEKHRTSIASAYARLGDHTGSTLHFKMKEVLRPPHSSYALSATPGDIYFGSEPTGTIGLHHPKEIVRIERDWSAGAEVCQFYSSWVMELEGRVTPTHFLDLINTINHHLQLAHSPGATVWENTLAVLTWHTSLWWYTSHYEKQIREVERVIEQANKTTWNAKGLNILSPRDVAFQFLEIEYY